MIKEQNRYNSQGKINYSTIQIAKVKSTDDEAHSGKLKVWLVQSNTDENNEANWISVRYASPFAGISDPEKMTTAVESSEGTQKQYGFFAVPPDKNNLVLVAFANGEPDEGFWFSGLYSDTLTHMIPGIAENATYQGTGPAAEVNRYSQQIEQPRKNPLRPQYSSLGNVSSGQNISDPQLGVGTSSVWRDLTPQVMGWLTPGGNQLILDDKDGNKLIRLRTASGVQILLNETTGDVFQISKSGNSWIRLGNDGNVDIYASDSINMFAGNNVNVTSGSDINFSAGQTMNQKAQQVNIEGSGGISFKAPPWSIVSSQITADVWQSLSANASPQGPYSPVGDSGSQASDPVRTPGRGGTTS